MLKVFTCCKTEWLEKLKQIENNSGIHLANMRLGITLVWKHAYCWKMLVTQNRQIQSNWRGSRGGLEGEQLYSSWGWSQFRGFAVRAVRHPHTLSHFEPGHGHWNCLGSQPWLVWGPKSPSSQEGRWEIGPIWSEVGRFRYYLRFPSLLYLLSRITPAERYIYVDL